ncbi:MAG: CDP-alcohol phosphatidyltransferase family protein [Xanthomonadales bacterium]|nr:CDP-alcohol phosphatidyltransferase family protein [Xanthomonadales bacterium]
MFRQHAGMWQQLPNALSLARILAVLPLAWCLQQGRFLPAAALFVAAALTDALDGYLARRFGWQSAIGGVLDPLADKLLMLASGILLYRLELLPGWLLLLMLGRDLVIVTGAAIYHRWFEPFRAEPSLLSKGATALQALLLLALMLQGAGYISAHWLQPLLLLTVTALIGSGLGYVIGYTRKAIHLRRSRP